MEAANADQKEETIEENYNRYCNNTTGEMLLPSKNKLEDVVPSVAEAKEGELKQTTIKQ